MGTSGPETTTRSVSRDKGSASRPRLAEVARFFLKLGLIGFGGPLVHIALMEDELVGEEGAGWTDEATFMDGLAICNMLPGPASTQLGIFMGWVRAGTLGALVAGVTFMAPTFLIVVALSFVYFRYGELPSVTAFFYGVNPVVIGLIAGAAYSMGRKALARGDAHTTFSVGGDEWRVDYRLVALLVGALVATVLINPNPVVEFAVAGAIAVALYQWEWLRTNSRRVSLAGGLVAVLTVLYLARDWLASRAAGLSMLSPIVGIAGLLWANSWVKLFAFMLYTGSFIFGGGLVLIPFIEKYVVSEFGWLTAQQFVDGIAIGQLTPGPVVMSTAFVGYKLMLDLYGSVAWAVIGAFVAMVGAFAPSFFFITVMFPYVARVRDNAVVGVALTGINAAVVGAIVGATITLGLDAIVDGFTALLALVSFVLFARGVDAAYLILGGGVVGAVVFFLF
ncbi:chromate efflux transporter [Haloferax namakaokahaiae]|uniref:Chromate efflux transporter n=1 Tax=Haloferax namakaokahaiae TaxID=1748331 RepID=A0ABD5ZFY5_9EURY